jgi:ribosomal protein S5
MLVENWEPITELGQMVKNNEFANITQLLSSPYKIKEPAILDYFGTYLVHIVNQRRVYKAVKSGRKSLISTHVIVVGSNYLIGFGSGRAMNKKDSVQLATKKAKMKILQIKLGHRNNPYTIERTKESKVSSSVVTIQPVNKGTGIVAPPLIKKVILDLGQIDIRVLLKGSNNPLNYMFAFYKALKQVSINELSKLERINEVK